MPVHASSRAPRPSRPSRSSHAARTSTTAKRAPDLLERVKSAFAQRGVRRVAWEGAHANVRLPRGYNLSVFVVDGQPDYVAKTMLVKPGSSVKNFTYHPQLGYPGPRRWKRAGDLANHVLALGRKIG